MVADPEIGHGNRAVSPRFHEKCRGGCEIEEFAQRGAGTRTATGLEPLAEKHQHNDDRRSLEVESPAVTLATMRQEKSAHALQESSSGSQRDE